MARAAGAAAVVTGAGQGLGRAIAEALAADGWAVAVVDMNPATAEETAEALRTDGASVIALAADVRSEEEVERVGSETESALGPIGAWINNAGISRPAMLHKMALDDFRLVLDVHATGTFLGIREAARRMIASETAGVILNVTSAAGLQGTIGQINYSGAKGAITAMTESAARELARYGIRANAVAPVAATPMTEKVRSDEKLAAKYLANIPLGRFAEPSEAAQTFRFLASDAAGYITGQVVCVDGGLYMAS